MIFQTFPSLLSIILAISCLAFAFALLCLAELFLPGILPDAIKHQISTVVNKFLERKYPINHKNGLEKIPSCPYVWPNGQGDSGKFLDGIENSAKWEKENGSIYRIWSGMQPEIVLTRPRHLQAVFKDSDKHMKAPANNSGHYMDQLLGRCVGLVSGHEWKTVRAIVEVPFGHRHVSLKVADFQHQVASYFDRLHKHGRLAHGLVHPADDMKMLPFWAVAHIFYGPLPAHLTSRLAELAPLREHIFKHVIEGGLHRYAWARFLPTTANAGLRKFKKAWKAFNDSAIQHAQAHNRDAPIIRMASAVATGEITEEQLLQTIDESLYANLDVTTGGLSWNLVFLAAHPHVQARLREEIAAAEEKQGLQDYIRDRTTYLAACVLESSRLRPLAAFSVPQAAPTDREVDGYVIPAGTSFVVDSYALNVRNEAWGPDNTAYRPDRFLGGLNTDRRYLFWRFGFGPRTCMGKHAADLVIRTTLVHLLRNYELGMLNNDEWVRNPECWITHPDFELRCVRRE